MVQTRQPTNPLDVAEIIAQQLQNIIPNIVTQVTNNLNNANGNGNDRGNNGCTYKGFVACGPRYFNRTGSAVALTRWIEKMESVIDNSGCLANQRVKYTDRFHWLVKLVSLLVTPEAKHVTRYINGLPSQIRGMIQATQPATIQATILTVGILTNEAVRNGTLAKDGEKRKERDEASWVTWPETVEHRLGMQSRYEQLGQEMGRELVMSVELALEGNRNTRGNENRARGRACNVNAVDAL
ncbi:hypothetical protein Tco_1127560 [Tanacetum coccineum]